MEQDAKRLLFERLDDCLKVHADMLDAENIAEIYELQDLAGLHYYLKAEHEYTPEEVEALLEFQDPLDVAYACKGANTHAHSFPVCELLEKIHADQMFEKYGEMPKSDRWQELMKRLGQDYFSYREKVLLMEKETVFDQAQEIVKMQDTYSFLVEHYEFQPEEIEKMLLLDNPLHYMAARWSNTVSEVLDYDLDDFVKDVIADIPGRSPSLLQKEPGSFKDRLQRAAQEVKEQGKKGLLGPSKETER